MIAFNRRQRHGTEATGTIVRQYYVTATQPNAVYAPPSAYNTAALSKKRSPSPSRHVPNDGSSASRKMSGLQLRVFFLICVALYCGTIYFADEIVKVAHWISEADPSQQWTLKPSLRPASPNDIKTEKAEATIDLAIAGEDDLGQHIDEVVESTPEPKTDQEVERPRLRVGLEEKGNEEDESERIDSTLEQTSAPPSHTEEYLDLAQTEAPTTSPVTAEPIATRTSSTYVTGHLVAEPAATTTTTIEAALTPPALVTSKPLDTAVDAIRQFEGAKEADEETTSEPVTFTKSV
ncbi:hypothetical protein Poli38472_012504 [Pythium oligandrum]|uniref:Uncharacterized protein n=1 Tax=Pythium oligandrum TaxID=41045 RepID=A0A8K1CEY5_PYTOL|nr:hypothetical protein Poli38472_012504 [Pythium oligandrum]|eukprot:TMW61313.1 hypothetical protein Poli38472_012504 [Pythium oligandrum]